MKGSNLRTYRERVRRDWQFPMLWNALIYRYTLEFAVPTEPRRRPTSEPDPNRKIVGLNLGLVYSIQPSKRIRTTLTGLDQRRSLKIASDANSGIKQKNTSMHWSSRIYLLMVPCIKYLFETFSFIFRGVHCLLHIFNLLLCCTYTLDKPMFAEIHIFVIAIICIIFIVSSFSLTSSIYRVYLLSKIRH